MQDEFAPAGQAAMELYEARFGKRLRAVYLAGSLACGEALAGISDMDIFAFVSCELDASDLQWRAQSEQALAGRFPRVEEFHLNTNSCEHLAKEWSWRFILRYNSVLLKGDDVVTELEQRGVPTPAPSTELAKDRIPWLRKCFEGAMAGGVPTELYTPPDNPYLATRKLARNFVNVEGAYPLMVDSAFISFRRQDVLGQLRKLYPQWEELYAMAESVQMDPLGAAVTPPRFMACLEPFVRWAIGHIESA